jgi:hypothetical protein
MAEMKTVSPQELSLEMLVDMANANAGLTMGEVRDLVAAHDVVVVVWQDVRSPNNVGRLAIKGANLLRQACASQTNIQARTTALPAMDSDYAQALLEVVGEQVRLS